MDSADHIPQPPVATLRDYVLEPYAPRASLDGRLHASSLLRAFLRDQGWLEGVTPLLDRLRAHLGPDQTVWGIKIRRQGPPSVELYWYNHCRNAPGHPMSTQALAAALDGPLRVSSPADARLPYLMCSLELDGAALAAGVAPPFRIYLPGRRDQEGYDGVSFRLEPDQLVQEGTYAFYPQPAQRAAYRARLGSAWRLGGADRRRWAADPALSAHHCVCYASKIHTEALYFGRVPTAALLGPLATLWPAQADRLAALAPRLDHLCWDLGVDFAVGPNTLDQSTVEKVGLYGVI